MKTTTIAIALVIGLLPTVQADTGNPPKRLPEFLRIFDLDGDGRLDAEERAAAKEARGKKRQEFIDKWDTDGDGKLSRDEIREARRQILLEILAKRRAKFLEIAGEDELISAEEFAAIPVFADKDPERVAKLFDHLDRDDDGFLSFEEFQRKLRRYPL